MFEVTLLHLGAVLPAHAHLMQARTRDNAVQYYSISAWSPTRSWRGSRRYPTCQHCTLIDSNNTGVITGFFACTGV